MTVLRHTRLTLSGVFGTTTGPFEVWQCNLATLGDPTTNAAKLQAAADGVSAAWGTRMKGFYRSDIVLTRVRAALIDPQGHVERESSGAYLQRDNTAAVPGTSATNTATYLPLQTALVASLLTDRPGQAGKGRIFLPFPTHFAIASDYRITAADATTFATAVANFVKDVASAVDSSIVVVGATSSKTGKEATLSSVKRIRVGRVPDTMRSRRSQMVEGYVQVDADTVAAATA